MAREKTADRSEAPKPAPAANSAPDDGTAELQARADEATAKGYFGSTPDPHPNSAYSLASGPNSPSAADATSKES